MRAVNQIIEVDVNVAAVALSPELTKIESS
jgi:hypothetical protein